MSPAFVAGGLAVDACVLTAMDDEAAPFIERASDVGESERFGNADHRLVEVEGLKVLLVRCGIGLVNAAGAATEAILRTGGAASGASLPGRAPLFVSAGSAGGVGIDVEVGQVVVGSQYVNADADVRVFDYVLGQSPGMPASYAPAAGALAALPPSGVNAEGDTFVVRRGLIVSSDTFISGERVGGIRSAFPGVLATDMESLAIAQVCHSYGVPFVSIRGISDLADPTAVGDHLTHVDDASDRSARVVLAMLAGLAAA